MTATIINLSDLFTDMLQDIYYAEKKILKALPQMAKALDNGSRLGTAFLKHLDETKGQVERLERVFELIGQKPKAKKCEAIEGITEEADELIKNVTCKSTLEAGLLAGAQAVEHYEIARYGTLVEWAKLLGHPEAAKLLTETLEEEKHTDAALNKLAVSAINHKALEAQQQREKEDDDTEDKEARSTIRHKAA
jgi:ferritin-like metal-binding protein YciE